MRSHLVELPDAYSGLTPQQKSKKCLRIYENTRAAFRDYDKQKQKCLDMVHGKHFDTDVEAARSEKGLPSLPVDKTMGVISSLDGWARRQRKDVQFIPLGEDDEARTRAYNSVYGAIKTAKGLAQRQSETYCLAATVDEAYLHIFPELNGEGQLEPGYEVLGFAEFYPDANSTDPIQMSDGEHGFVTKYMSPQPIKRLLRRYLDQQAMERLDRYNEEDLEPGLTRNQKIRWDDRYARNGQLQVVKMYYKRYVGLRMLIDEDTDEARPLDPAEAEYLTPDMLTTMGFRIEEVEREQIWCAYMIPALKLDKLIGDARADFQPLNVVTGKMYWPVVRLPHKHIGGKAVGALRVIMKLQEARNILLSAFLHHLQTAANGGFLYEGGAFADEEEERKFRVERNRANISIKVADDALKEKRIQPIPKTEMAFSDAGQLFEAILIDSIRDITGDQPVMNGVAQQGAPASLFAQQVDQSSTRLIGTSDLFSEFQDVVADITMAFVRQFYTDRRVVRIEGRDGKDEMLVLNDPYSSSIFNDVAQGLYTVRKTEIPATQSARRARLKEGVEVLEIMQKLGLPSILLDFETVIRDLDWPQDKKERWLQEFQTWKQLQGLVPPAGNATPAAGVPGGQLGAEQTNPANPGTPSAAPAMAVTR